LVRGVQNKTNQVKDVNQTVEKGDAPALNRGAPGAQAVRAPPVDRRAIIALIKAVAGFDSFVIPYSAVMDELSDMIEDYDEYHKIEESLYDAIYDGKLEYVYNIYQFDDFTMDLIVVSPEPLSKEQLQILHEIASVYDTETDDAVVMIINKLVEKWTSSCLEVSGPAKAILTLAKKYGLNVRLVTDETKREPYTGRVVYDIENAVTVVKHVFYCNNCINGDWFNGTFIEKCETWEIADDEGGGGE
jgi:hypothetical protein